MPAVFSRLLPVLTSAYALQAGTRDDGIPDSRKIDKNLMPSMCVVLRAESERKVLRFRGGTGVHLHNLRVPVLPCSASKILGQGTRRNATPYQHLRSQTAARNCGSEHVEHSPRIVPVRG